VRIHSSAWNKLEHLLRRGRRRALAKDRGIFSISPNRADAPQFHAPPLAMLEAGRFIKIPE